MALTPEWHQEAKRLNAAGMTVGEICQKLDKQWTSVALAVDHNGFRDHHRTITREPKRRYRENLRIAVRAAAAAYGAST